MNGSVNLASWPAKRKSELRARVRSSELLDSSARAAGPGRTASKALKDARKALGLS